MSLNGIQLLPVSSLKQKETTAKFLLLKQVGINPMDTFKPVPNGLTVCSCVVTEKSYSSLELTKVYQSLC